MLIYITWDIVDVRTSETRLSKVHLTEVQLDRAPTRGKGIFDRRFLTLCGVTTSLLVGPRRVSSWLNRPCRKCKAIRATHSGTMEGYHTLLEKQPARSTRT